MRLWTTGWMMGTLVLLAAGGQLLLNGQSRGGYDGFKLVDKSGNISKPPNYRDTFRVMGTYAVIDVKGNELHYSYASPGAIESYRRDKKFADGSVLVKEVYGTEHAKLTTGDANWASNIKVWFVLIKDAKRRYANNPLWGDGWGWALFKSDAPDKQVAVDYKKDCLSCHIPAKADDWIYVNGYPALRSR
jgi:Cytochrome P460